MGKRRLKEKFQDNGWRASELFVITLLQLDKNNN
jgi:hypothetical protein